MISKKTRRSRGHHRLLKRHKLAPTVEAFERRQLLTTGVFLQGTAFIDANANSLLDAGDSPLPGATIKLFDSTGTTQLGHATTDANGQYLFKDGNGTVDSNNLTPGTYQLVEVPTTTGPAYFVSGTQALWQLGATPTAGPGVTTITATVVDPSKVFVHYQGTSPGETLTYHLTGDPFATGGQDTTILGQLQINAGTTSGGSDLNPDFVSYCIALTQDLNGNPFPVLPTPNSSGLPSGAHAGAELTLNAGRIAYLYNHYGTQSLDADHAAALQAALGALTVDANPTDITSTSNNFYLINPPANVKTDANFYLSDSVGKNETAIFLDASVGGTVSNPFQSLLAKGSLNFANTPKASPAINTVASEVGNVVGSAVLSDTATLTGGFNPGGTITFTLTQPDHTTITVGSQVTVTGDATYTPTTTVIATEVGNYTWHAHYSGDTNNNPADDNGANEGVTTVQASPAINTVASEVGNVVGSAVLSDTATLSGGFNPGGTITFTLTQPDHTTITVGTPVTVTGDATYTPTTTVIATEVGNYTWHAHYSGDTNNNPADDNGANEGVTTVQASPAINTVASEVGNVVGSAVLSDTATLSGGFNPGGTITFTLTQPDHTTITVGTPVTVTGDATYTPTTTVIATEVGNYTWHAHYSGDTNNNPADDNGANEGVTTVQASPAINTVASEVGNVVGSAVLSDTATLTGGFNPGGTITFTLTQPDHTTITVGTPVTVTGDATYTPTTTVIATEVGNYTWHAHYSGDTNNNPADDNGANEGVATVKTSPTIVTTASENGNVQGSAILSDSATISGTFTGTGSISFTLTQPDGTTITVGSPVNVTGNGTYSPTTTVLATEAGTYTWHASYSGDSLNNGAIDNGQNESLTVIPASPPVLTITKVADQGTVTGGSSIGFTVTITESGGTATNVVLNDPLPAGAGGDMLWTAGTITGAWSPTITGAKGSQVLTATVASMPPGTYSVHITSPTNANDALKGTPAPGFDPTGTAAASIINLAMLFPASNANNFGVLGLQNTAITNSLVTVHGNEGVSQGGSLVNMAPSTITGNVYEYANGQYSGPGTVGGSIIINPTLMTQVDANALNASTVGAGLTPDFTLGTISSATTVTATAASRLDGVNVVKITGDIKNSLTLSGTASDVFVVNISGAMTMTGSTGLFLAGGLTANHVLYNFTGSSGALSTNVGNTFFGTILAPHYTWNLDGNFVGELICGGATIKLLSGAKVNTGSTITNTATVSADNVTAQNASSIITIQPGSLALVSSDSGASVDTTGVVGSGFALNQGTILVYVDNTDGTISPDQQARIDDAIATDNTELNPYGLTLVEVGADQADSASITIMVADTTPIGGVAQGVLGVTEMDGAIILVGGWNWYAGADPSGIGSDQYDFETAVAHELGHGIGLGHSPDTTSVMYPMLATDQSRRSLSADDLTNIADFDTGPEPLLAAPIARGPASAAPQAPADLTQPTATAVQPTATAVTSTAPVLPVAVVANHTATTPASTIGATFGVSIGSFSSNGSAQVLGGAATTSLVGMMAQPQAGVTTTPVTTGLLAQQPAWSAIQPAVSSSIASEHAAVVSATDRDHSDALILARPRMSLVSDSVLDEVATEAILWQARKSDGTITIPVLLLDSVPGAVNPTDPSAPEAQPWSSGALSKRLAVFGMAAGLWGGAKIVNARRRRSGSLSFGHKALDPRSSQD